VIAFGWAPSEIEKLHPADFELYASFAREKLLHSEVG
jgi:hypothetical protein